MNNVTKSNDVNYSKKFRETIFLSLLRIIQLSDNFAFFLLYKQLMVASIIMNLNNILCQLYHYYVPMFLIEFRLK